MVMTDPVADFLTRIRNGNMVMHQTVEVPGSKMKVGLAKILKVLSFEQSSTMIISQFW